MIALSDEQSALSRSAATIAIVLMRLQTFTDHTAETVESTFYFSKNVPLWYQWDGATRSVFRDVIRTISPLQSRIDHLPNAGNFATRERVTLNLDNTGTGEKNLWRELRSKNLSYARADIASLLVNPSQFQNELWWDLGSASNDHLVLFRGELTRVGSVTERDIPLTFETIEKDVDWPEALEATEVDPKDLGKRYPIPVGQAKDVPCINRKVGFVTTLAQELTSSTTGNVEVTDTLGFPESGTFEIQVGAERMDASTVDEDTVSISNRGKGATTAGPHKTGEAAIEIISQAEIVFSGVQADALQRLYVLSPITGDKVRIRPAFYSVDLANTALDAGRTLGVASITQANFQSLMDELVAAAQVTQQPAFQNATETFYIPARSRTIGSDSDADSTTTLSSQPDGIRLNTTAGAGNTGQFAVNSLDIGAQLSGRTMVRWRFIATINGFGGNGGVFERDVPLSAKVNGSATEQQPYTFNNGAQEFGVTIALNWTTTSSLVSTLGGDFVEFYLDSRGGTENATWTSGNNFCWISDVMIEVEVVGQSPTRTTDVAIVGTSLGFGLEFSADVDGAPVPTATAAEYPGSAGDLIEHPLDVMRWFLADFVGEGHAAIDDPTWTTARDAIAAGEVQVLDFESDSGNFTQGAGTGSVADESTVVFEGSGSLKMTSGTGAEWWYRAVTLNMTGRLWRFRIYLDSSGTAHNLDANDGLFAGISTTADVSANFGQWNFGSNDVSVTDQWVDLEFDPTSFSLENGTVDLSDIKAVYFGINRINTASGKIAYFDDARRTKPAARLAGDLRAAGNAFGEVLARLGFESRTNLLASYTQSATLYKALNAGGDYAYPASGGTLADIVALRESRKVAAELVNRFRAAYAFDPSQSLATVESFSKLLRVDADQNDLDGVIPTADLTASETALGERLGELLGFRFLQDIDSVSEVFGFYVHEHLRASAARFGVTVPLRDGYALEPGDIRSLQPRWSDSAIKCRVTQKALSGDAAEVSLNLEEVE